MVKSYWKTDPPYRKHKGQTQMLRMLLVDESHPYSSGNQVHGNGGMPLYLSWRGDRCGRNAVERSGNRIRPGIITLGVANKGVKTPRTLPVPDRQLSAGIGIRGGKR